GIYCIERIETGQRYIGKGKNLIQEMWRGHAGCTYIYRAIKKHGDDAFIRYVVEYCEIGELDYWEKYYIREWNTKVPNGYNLTDGGEGTLGYNHTEKSKKQMSFAKKGKLHSEERKKARRLKMAGRKGPTYGKPMLEKTKKLLSTARKGKPISENHKNAISVGLRAMYAKSPKKRGMKHRDESKKRISNATKGENNPRFGTKLSTATSQFHGVFKIVRKKKKYIRWGSRVGRTTIGEYKTEVEAALAHDKYIRENNSPYPLNFPKEDEQ
ncbi:MAG: hypothetical protein IMZ52_04210, partial [Actinobacteria bacterium]|nr:hypothetical protein [Actinomycetota bacterium]